MSPPPFQTFLDRHRDAVYRFLVFSVGPDDADDCLQETFTAALRAYPRLEDGSNLRAWVLTIAHRKAIDTHRGRARRPVPAADLPEKPAPAVTLPDPGLWEAVGKLPRSSAPPSCCASSPTSRSDRSGAFSTSRRRRRVRTCTKGSRTYERNTQMTNFELDDIEAALRRGAAVDVDTQAEAATISAIAAADREGLIDVAVATVDSPVGDLLLAATPQGLVRLAFDPERRARRPRRAHLTSCGRSARSSRPGSP